MNGSIDCPPDIVNFMFCQFYTVLTFLYKNLHEENLTGLYVHGIFTLLTKKYTKISQFFKSFCRVNNF